MVPDPGDFDPWSFEPTPVDPEPAGAPKLAKPVTRPKRRLRLPDSGPRRYPNMLALLDVEVVTQRPPQPMHRRVAPVAKAPDPPEGAPVELDRMLEIMAEGLLIGETQEGHTQVRITLKDDFFSGTELQMVSMDGWLKASLLPPDLSTYYELNARIDELKTRLVDKGLRVEDIELLRP